MRIWKRDFPSFAGASIIRIRPAFPGPGYAVFHADLAFDGFDPGVLGLETCRRNSVSSNP